MGHKLQLSKFSDITRAVIEDENGVMIATTVGDIDHEKIANQFITAVNAVPEMKTFLRRVQAGGLRTRRTIERKASELLEKLEGIDG